MAAPKPYAHLPHYQAPDAPPFPTLKMAAWATSGVVLNAWARSMARLPLRAGPLSYSLFALGSASVGYALHRFELSLFTAFEMKKDAIVIRRQALLDAAAENDAEH